MLGHAQPALAAWRALVDTACRAEDGAAAFVAGSGCAGARLPFLACTRAAWLPRALHAVAAQLGQLPPEWLQEGEDGGGGAPGGGGQSFLVRAAGVLARTCAAVEVAGAPDAAPAAEASASASPRSQFLSAARAVLAVCRARFGWRVEEGAPPAQPPVPLREGEEAAAYSSREALMAALAAEAGEFGDEGMPAIVEEVEE